MSDMTAQSIHMQLSPEEADAVLHLLLNAPPNALVSDELTDRLLCRFADAHRSAVQGSKNGTQNVSNGTNGSFKREARVRTRRLSNTTRRSRSVDSQ